MDRAKEVLSSIEKEKNGNKNPVCPEHKNVSFKAEEMHHLIIPKARTSLGSSRDNQRIASGKNALESAILAPDLLTMTPIEALNLFYELQQKVLKDSAKKEG